MNITFPEGSFNTINQMRGVVGRNVTISVNVGQIACTVSGCDLDPTTNESTNVFCSGCYGDYWIQLYSGYTLSGHIRWGPADGIYWQPGGQLEDGSCKVTLRYSTKNLQRVKDSYSFLVDGKLLYVQNFKLKGIRGPNEEHQPSRIQVTLKEEED